MIPADIKGWEEMTGCTSDTYRVGLLADLADIWRIVRMPAPKTDHEKRYRLTRSKLISYRQHAIGQGMKSGRRSYLNGWLCELDQPGPRVWAFECGKGWTQKQAQRSLVRHLIAVSDEMATRG